MSQEEESSEKVSASSIPEEREEDADRRCGQILEELWEEFPLSPSTPLPWPVIWVSGAPGSGKGVNAGYVKRVLGISAEPVVISELLQSQDSRSRIDHGDLVDDLSVIRASLKALLQARGGEGLLMDGYPRSLLQAKFLHRLEEKWRALGLGMLQFRMLVFSVDEATSLERQLSRGRKAMAHNQEVKRTGKGVLREVRPTDIDETLARRRYHTFLQETDAALRHLQSTGMPFVEIDSRGPFEVVQRRIEQKLRPWISNS
ncbi:MAG: nucleoside monophosphate kinase [Puniceicoccales bacterium]|nr:nucleoside monophosphate kinase [Puniceicoccales bacterium]